MTKEVHDRVIYRDGFQCQNCKKFLPYDQCEIAHRIKRGKKGAKNNSSELYVIRFAYEKYGISLSKKKAGDILDHPFNLRTVCRNSNVCNDAMNCFNNPFEADEILKEIFDDLGYKMEETA